MESVCPEPQRRQQIKDERALTHLYLQCCATVGPRSAQQGQARVCGNAWDDFFAVVS